jgi:hypothetical protein
MQEKCFPERPASIALISAIEDVIYDLAPGKITPIEVLGCLDMVSKAFYKNEIGDADDEG